MVLWQSGARRKASTMAAVPGRVAVAGEASCASILAGTSPANPWVPSNETALQRKPPPGLTRIGGILVGITATLLHRRSRSGERAPNHQYGTGRPISKTGHGFRRLLQRPPRSR